MSDLVPVAPGVRVLAVRTPTLPPATHTNCYVAGTDRLTVVDPASPWPDEQRRLAEALDAAGTVERVILTHHHPDHVAGAEALRRHLADLGHDVPIVAHVRTAELVAGEVTVDLLLDDEAVIDAGGLALRALHTPGHAPGHLVLHDEAAGTMIAGDMVAGVGTVVIDPVDGDLGDYLASLGRMQARAPRVLLPAHGGPLEEARALLGFYVAHRHQRTEQIRRALDAVGTAGPEDLVARVYPDLPAAAQPVAAMQILAHLRWMAAHGLAEPVDEGRYRAR